MSRNKMLACITQFRDETNLRKNIIEKQTSPFDVFDASSSSIPE
jgi:hypothetical protein